MAPEELSPIRNICLVQPGTLLKPLLRGKMIFSEVSGIDGVLLPVHKAFQFLGMKPLPSFMANDVDKNPTFEEDRQRFKEHLKKVFA